MLKYFNLISCTILSFSCAQNETTVVQNPIPCIKTKECRYSEARIVKGCEVVPTNSHNRQDLESGLYVERKVVEIRDAEQRGGGSLFDPDSKTIDFRDNQIIGVGSYVKLYVKEVRNRDEPEDDSAPEEADVDALTEELLGELPDFEPLKGMKDKVLPIIHARVCGANQKR